MSSQESKQTKKEIMSNSNQTKMLILDESLAITNAELIDQPTSSLIDIKNDQRFINTIKELAMVWETTGLPNRERSRIVNDLRANIMNKMDEIKAKQRKLLEEYLLIHENRTNELLKLTNGLTLQPYVLPHGLTLIQQIDALEQEIKRLNVIKNQRMDRLEEIISELTQLCSMLGIECPTPMFATDIPDPNELNQLQTQLTQHKEQLLARKRHCQTLKDWIEKICFHLDYYPANDQESYLLDTDLESFVFSESNMIDLKNFHVKITKQYSALESEVKDSLDYLQQLYDRLYIDQQIRTDFLNSLTGTIKEKKLAIDEEIEKYEKMKKDCMETLIKNIHAEIATLSEKCLVRVLPILDKITLDDTVSNSDETLEKLENELGFMKRYATLYQEVFEKISDWKNSLARMLELEKRSTDPNRYNNRGGVLLQEERDRKLLKKKLPKLEQDIRMMIKMIQAKENVPFDSYGLDIERFFSQTQRELSYTYSINSTGKSVESNCNGKSSSTRTRSNNSDPPIQQHDIREIYFQIALEKQTDLHSTRMDCTNVPQQRRLQRTPTSSNFRIGKREMEVMIRRRSRSFNDLTTFIQSNNNKIGKSIKSRKPFLP